MIQSVIIIFVLLGVFAFFWPPKSRDKIAFGLVFIVLTMLAAFRDGDFVRDYKEYLELFEHYSSWIELSFELITYIVKYLEYDVVFLFFIYALLGVGLKLKAIQMLSEFWFISLLIYFGNFYLLHEITQIRVGVAAAFLLFACQAIYDKNVRRFLFFSALAIFFHYSSLIILPLWFLSSKKQNTLLFAMLIPIAYLFYFFSFNIIEFVMESIPIQYIQNKYSTYKLLQAQKVSSFVKINVFNYLFLIKIMLYYLLLWKSEQIKKENVYATLLIKVWGIGLASFILLASMPVFAFRVSELFTVVEIITIPFLMYLIKPTYLGQLALFIIAFTLLFINVFYVKLIL